MLYQPHGSSLERRDAVSSSLGQKMKTHTWGSPAAGGPAQVGSHPQLPRILPRKEGVDPARNELRVPGEKEDGEQAEEDEDHLLSKPVAQTPESQVSTGFRVGYSRGRTWAGTHSV